MHDPPQTGTEIRTKTVKNPDCRVIPHDGRIVPIVTLL